MSSYEFLSSQFGFPVVADYEPRVTEIIDPDLFEEQVDEIAFLRLFGNNVPVLKEMATRHQRLKIEIAKVQALKDEISMHAAHTKIEAAYDLIEEIYNIDSETKDEKDLGWLRVKATGYKREVNDLKNGTSLTPPRPDIIDLLDRVKKYTSTEEVVTD